MQNVGDRGGLARALKRWYYDFSFQLEMQRRPDEYVFYACGFKGSGPRATPSMVTLFPHHQTPA